MSDYLAIPDAEGQPLPRRGRGPDKAKRKRRKTKPESVTISFRMEAESGRRLKALPGWADRIRALIASEILT